MLLHLSCKLSRRAKLVGGDGLSKQSDPSVCLCEPASVQIPSDGAQPWSEVSLFRGDPGEVGLIALLLPLQIPRYAKYHDLLYGPYKPPLSLYAAMKVLYSTCVRYAQAVSA